MQYIFCCNLLALVYLFISSPFIAPVFADDSGLASAFESALESVQKQYNFPGATAAYALSGGTVHSVATGLADVETGTPMTPASRMLAASVGKTFVGATVVALVQDGLVGIDDPVFGLLGDRPWYHQLPNHEDITINHLLKHLSGLPDHVYLDSFRTAFTTSRGQDTKSFSPEDLIAFVLQSEPLSDAGEEWHYSDTGYLLLGLIIEEVTGQDYYDEVTNRFIKPLGLHSTSPSDQRTLPGLAAGYMAKDNRYGLPPKSTDTSGHLVWHPGIEWTGGGLISTSKDLALWGQRLFSGEAMKPPYLDTLLDSVAISEGMPVIRYAAGAGIVEDEAFGTTYGHGGWIPGYTSVMRYYADYEFTISFQINTDIGIVDDSTPVVEDLQKQLAETVIRFLK